MAKKALITGITGQDGSYLCDLLLSKGYEVHGIVRRSSHENRNKLKNILHVIDKVKLHLGSIDNHLSIYKIIDLVKPDEVYHLAAESFVVYSFDDENSIMSQNFNSTHYMLSSLRDVCPNARFFFAGSSEMFGDAVTSPQDENTPFNPRAIYGISKVASHFLVRKYRKDAKLFACTGFMYNHESPRRGRQFVPSIIAHAAARIKLGLQDHFELGNVSAVRDWGYAPDYMDAVWRMLQQPEPDDFVVASGKLNSVKHIAEVAFNHVGLKLEDHLRTSDKFFRPSESVALCGNAAKAAAKLGWKSTKAIDDVMKEMVDVAIAEHRD